MLTAIETVIFSTSIYAILQFCIDFYRHLRLSLVFHLSPQWYFHSLIHKHALENVATCALLSLEKVPSKKVLNSIRTHFVRLLEMGMGREAITISSESQSVIQHVKTTASWFNSIGVHVQVINPDKHDVLSVCPSVLIQECLTVIITNALQASMPGLPIVVKVTRDQRYVVVHIQDFGLGMNKLQLLKSRWFGVSSKQTGSGLGLASAEWIVTKYCKGKLKIASTPSVGTRVSCYFPSSFCSHTHVE